MIIIILPMQNNNNNNWMLEQCLLSIAFESITKKEKKISKLKIYGLQCKVSQNYNKMSKKGRKTSKKIKIII